MGLNLTAHQYNEETKIYEFAPMEHFGKSILFDDEDVPTFKMSSRIHHLLIAKVGLDYQEQTYNTGHYHFDQKAIEKTHFGLVRETFNYQDWGLSPYVLKELQSFFETCAKYGYTISVG